MLDLSPVKILIVLVVAVILVGPDKLPQAARQMGAGWRKLRDLHTRIDEEVRQNIPDLPSTSEIARLARSPLAFLNQMADIDTSPTPFHESDDVPPSAASGSTSGEHQSVRGIGADATSEPGLTVRRTGTGEAPTFGDPSLN